MKALSSIVAVDPSILGRVSSLALSMANLFFISLIIVYFLSFNLGSNKMSNVRNHIVPAYRSGPYRAECIIRILQF